MMSVGSLVVLYLLVSRPQKEGSHTYWLFWWKNFSLPMLWYLLVQPYLRKFLKGLELLCLHSWKLSSNLSAGLVCCEEAMEIIAPMSGNL